MEVGGLKVKRQEDGLGGHKVRAAVLFGIFEYTCIWNLAGQNLTVKIVKRLLTYLI